MLVVTRHYDHLGIKGKDIIVADDGSGTQQTYYK